MPWPRRIRITRGQGSLNRFEVIIWAEDLSFSELSPESLCTLLQDRNASTNSRCRLTPAKETKVCPVCDTPIDANARVCPSCQTDLTLFDIGGGLDPTDTPVKDGRSIDEILASIMEGKEDHREIFETLKNVGRETPPIVAAIRAEAPPTRSFTAPTAGGKPARSPLQNRIDQLRRTRRESERRIPTGDRKLLYRELPKLVNEVKPLLVSAKRIGLEIEEGKRIINDAIQAGKRRDIERAVTLIADARRTLDVAFVDLISAQNDASLQQMRAAQGDAGVQAATPKLQEALGRLAAGAHAAARA